MLSRQNAHPNFILHEFIEGYCLARVVSAIFHEAWNGWQLFFRPIRHDSISLSIVEILDAFQKLYAERFEGVCCNHTHHYSS